MPGRDQEHVHALLRDAGFDEIGDIGRREIRARYLGLPPGGSEGDARGARPGHSSLTRPRETLVWPLLLQRRGGAAGSRARVSRVGAAAAARRQRLAQLRGQPFASGSAVAVWSGARSRPPGSARRGRSQQARPLGVAEGSSTSRRRTRARRGCRWCSPTDRRGRANRRSARRDSAAGTTRPSRRSQAGRYDEVAAHRRAPLDRRARCPSPSGRHGDGPGERVLVDHAQLEPDRRAPTATAWSANSPAASERRKTSTTSIGTGTSASVAYPARRAPSAPTDGSGRSACRATAAAGRDGVRRAAGLPTARRPPRCRSRRASSAPSPGPASPPRLQPGTVLRG